MPTNGLIIPAYTLRLEGRSISLPLASYRGQLQCPLAMVDVKRIIVVDDHFRIVDSIKTMLEASWNEYEVIGVPSAEEGIFYRTDHPPLTR